MTMQFATEIAVATRTIIVIKKTITIILSIKVATILTLRACRHCDIHEVPHRAQLVRAPRRRCEPTNSSDGAGHDIAYYSMLMAQFMHDVSYTRHTL